MKKVGGSELPGHRSLSPTELRVLFVTGGVFWFFAWADKVLFSHEWFSARGLEIVAISLTQPLTVILGTLLVAVALRRVAEWRQWNTTERVFKIVRFGILFCAVFLSLLAAHAGLPTVIPGGYSWGFGIDYYWTLPFAVLTAGFVALGLIWAYPKKRDFILASGLVAVVVGSGFIIRRPPLVLKFDSWWYEMLDSVRPWRNIDGSNVTIVTMNDWPGEVQFRRLTETVVRSQPKVVGMLAPVYLHIAESGDTSFYSTIPAGVAVYGVDYSSSPWHSPYYTDLPMPANIRQRRDRGVITGVVPGAFLSGSYEWETSCLPVLGAGTRIPYSEESIDVGLAIVGKYLGIGSPMPVSRTSSFWSGGILHAAGRDIPLTDEGKVLINFPTRYRIDDWKRYEWTDYESHYWVSPDFSPGVDPSETTLTFHRAGGRLPDSLGYTHWKSLEYRLHDGRIQRRLSEYLNADLLHVDSMEVPNIPELRGKIVLISQQQAQRKYTGQEDIIGFSYASIIQNLLDSDFITPLNVWWSSSFLLIVTGVVVVLFLRKSAARACGMASAIAIACVCVLAILLSWLQVYVSVVPVVVPLALALGLLFPVELRRERRKLMEERVALSSELRAAHEAEMGLMPTSDPGVPGFDISGLCRPADEVGGDYFDYVWLDRKKTRLGIATADVSGKAMKAAMTAVMTSGMVYREIGHDQTPKVILREINRPMYLKTDRRIFTAMSFAVIDIRKKTLTLSNAGQMQPLLKRRDAVRSLTVDGMRLPLGMVEDADYREVRLPLRPKDVIVFYTDGVPEAMNAKNEMFGFERLEAIVRGSSTNLPARQLASSIVEQVAEFTGPTKQHDDMTVVVVRVL